MNFFKGMRAIKTTISPQEVHRMMEETENFILLDVRTPSENKQARIEGAKLIPVDELANRAPSELPDKNVLILVYCQSGMRAGNAVRILKRMGYANAYSFGGITSWPYDIVSG